MPGVERGPAPLAHHPVVLIAAMARNRIIGDRGRLPWHLPADLAYFQATTMGHPVVMGRRTYETVGCPLPGRPTIVLSADASFAPVGVTTVRTLADAFREADRHAEALRVDAIMVAGGGMIYASTIAAADHMLLTMIEAEPAGDALFPSIDLRVWVKIDERPAPHNPEDSARYSFTAWARRTPLPRGDGMAERD